MEKPALRQWRPALRQWPALPIGPGGSFQRFDVCHRVDRILANLISRSRYCTVRRAWGLIDSCKILIPPSSPSEGRIDSKSTLVTAQWPLGRQTASPARWDANVQWAKMCQDTPGWKGLGRNWIGRTRSQSSISLLSNEC